MRLAAMAFRSSGVNDGGIGEANLGRRSWWRRLAAEAHVARGYSPIYIFSFAITPTAMILSLEGRCAQYGRLGRILVAGFLTGDISMCLDCCWIDLAVPMAHFFQDS